MLAPLEVRLADTFLTGLVSILALETRSSYYLFQSSLNFIRHPASSLQFRYQPCSPAGKFDNAKPASYTSGFLINAQK
jgi:hypothetical protein